jgi:hypothetical protein
MGSMGSRQGEMKVIMPSRKEMAYCKKSHPLCFLIVYPKEKVLSVMISRNGEKAR